MMFAIYAYNDNGKVSISTILPGNLVNFPSFDLAPSIPCPFVFVDELMLSIQNNPEQDFIYRLLIDIPMEVLSTFPQEDGKVLASVWLSPSNDGNLYYGLTPIAESETVQILTLDPPQPIDVKKLKEFSSVYSNSLRRMVGSPKILVIKIVIRVPIPG